MENWRTHYSSKDPVKATRIQVAPGREIAVYYYSETGDLKVVIETATKSIEVFEGIELGYLED